ncbi:hypothetical protein C1H76_3546 [Elsinoe australis]|uniref:Uncharacterized protein n=1 Tax=Elsinoe australis TaxID=40998 RepID=A0A4U7AZU1_9PEZI|nr:hypothetical protein C1H76_3546 [Elsinoe australis]
MKVQLALTTLIALSSAAALKPRDDNNDNFRQVAPAAATTPGAAPAPAPAPGRRPEDCTDDDDDDRNDPRCFVNPAPAPAAPNTTPAPRQNRDDDSDDGDYNDFDDCYDDGANRFRSEVPVCTSRFPGGARPTGAAAPAPGQYRDDDRDDGDYNDFDDCYDDGANRFRSEVPVCASRFPGGARPTGVPVPGQFRDDDSDDGDYNDYDDCYDDGANRFRSEVPVCASRFPQGARPTGAAAPAPVPGQYRDDDSDDGDYNDFDDCYDDGANRFRSEVPVCASRFPGGARPTGPVAGAPAATTGTSRPAGAAATPTTTRAANGTATGTATRTGIVASFTGAAVPMHATSGWVSAAVLAVAGLLAY